MALRSEFIGDQEIARFNAVTKLAQSNAADESYTASTRTQKMTFDLSLEKFGDNRHEGKLALTSMDGGDLNVDFVCSKPSSAQPSVDTTAGETIRWTCSHQAGNLKVSTQIVADAAGAVSGIFTRDITDRKNPAIHHINSWALQLKSKKCGSGFTPCDGYTIKTPGPSESLDTSISYTGQLTIGRGHLKLVQLSQNVIDTDIACTRQFPPQ